MNLHCRPVDVSRTCFEAWKEVPGQGPRRGRYFFVDGQTDFVPHSMLGGHWFEGKPFQTGPWSTQESPAPLWVNGSTVLPPTWPATKCCGWGIKKAFITRVRMSQSRVRSPFFASMNQTDLISNPNQVVAYFQRPGLWIHWLTINCPGEQPTYVAQGCTPAAIKLQTINNPTGDPDYLYTLFVKDTSGYWLGSGTLQNLCQELRSVQFDVFGVFL